MNEFESVLASKGFRDAATGYRQYVDIGSFADYLIFQEFSKNIDGLRRSLFFSKDKGGKITMGPLWDFDLAFGNLRWGHMSSPKGFLYNHFDLSSIMLPNAFWFKRMMKDPYFRSVVKERYFSLRGKGQALDTEEVLAEIDQLSSIMHDGLVRDRQRWHETYNVIQKTIMNTHQRGHSADGEIEVLRKWVVDRLDWLDEHIAKL
jgi:hypothetical protein